MKEYALIVAGGKGLRFGSHLPKQFVELNGKPVLMHTIDAFYRYSQDIDVVLVLPEQEIALWQSLITKHKYSRAPRVVRGGATRFQSVRNGLQMIPENSLVAIHDGVRPLVTEGVIRESFRLAAASQSAVACVPLKESLRMIAGLSADENFKSWAVNRSSFRLIQTPQTFQTALIKKAYTIDEDPDLTDDASVAEKAGYAVQLFEGRYDNIKITEPDDLLVAAALMRPGTGL